MTPPSLDRDTAAARLRAMRDSLDELDALRDATPSSLRDEPLTRAAAERLIQVVVDLAVDVNGHVAVSASGAAPATGRDSFIAAAAVGAIDGELAERLVPSAGLRSVLVHRYTDIRTDLVAECIERLEHVLEDAAQRAMAANIVERVDEARVFGVDRHQTGERGRRQAFVCRDDASDVRRQAARVHAPVTRRTAAK